MCIFERTGYIHIIKQLWSFQRVFMMCDMHQEKVIIRLGQYYFSGPGSRMPPKS